MMAPAVAIRWSAQERQAPARGRGDVQAVLGFGVPPSALICGQGVETVGLVPPQVRDARRRVSVVASAASAATVG